MIDSKPSMSPARRLPLFFIMLLGLSACAGSAGISSVFPPVASETPAPTEQDEARSTSEEKRPARPRNIDNDAEFYLEAAAQTEGKERNALTLRAAEAAYFQDRAELALEIMDSLSLNELPNSQRRRAILLLSELGQFADRPLTLLSELQRPGSQVPDDIAIRTLEARAQAHLALGQTLEAISALVAQEKYLSDSESRHEHHEHIWRTLRSAPPMDTNSRAVSTYDRATQGWVKLADVMLDLWLGPEELSAAVENWERQYPRHPANYTVLSREVRSRTPAAPSLPTLFPRERKFETIALLLPLSGPYATPAAAIRDGFMTAYYRRAEPRPEVIVFDTGNPNDSIERIAEQALLAGADILVGPLAKNNVTRLAQSLESPVPTLALNYLERSAASTGSFYQFGLSPEDEAEQVADRALEDGRLNALGLVPDTDWGRRTLRAFQSRIRQRGGQLLDFEFFDPKKTDFRDPLTRLLRYTVTQKDNERVVTIREDMDYIFIAAQPEQARLLRPQLRFYRASRVPVYATSHIYTGRANPRQDQDLDGIRFGDMPWILDQNADLRDARDQAAKLWPDSYSRLPRLYALGFDAFALATQIAKNNLRPGYGYPAASGVLTLEQGGRVSRKLVWAHFSGGLARLIGAHPPAEAPLVKEEEPEEGFLPEEILQ